MREGFALREEMETTLIAAYPEIPLGYVKQMSAQDIYAIYKNISKN